jgi:hypothetical protein
MASCEIIIQIQNAGSTEVLKSAWVYWGAAGNFTLLRSNQDGRLLSLQGGADRNQPWQYTQQFTTTIGATVDIYYSRGALPIPDARLKEHQPVFFHRTITAGPVPNPLPNANLGPNQPSNTLIVRTVIVILPPILITLTTPKEIRLWPILWELPKDCDLDPACRAQHPADRTPDYHTAGLDQGTSVWPSDAAAAHPVTHPNVQENTAPLALPDHVVFNQKTIQIRPREKAAHFQGAIDSRATGVTIQMLDRTGNVVQLRPNINTTSAAADHVAGTLTAGSAAKTYAVDLFFVDAVNTFGIVQLFVQSVGMTPPIVEAFTGYLCGFQITLLDDGAGAANGSDGGPAGLARGALEMDEAHEKLMVDFIHSPQTSVANIRRETRLRRMCTFQLRNRQRPLDLSAAAGPTNPNVLRPEMPLWMAEFQAVGVSSAPLATVMALRAFYDHFPFDLTLDLNWSFTIAWHGPDRAQGQDPHNVYQYDPPDHIHLLQSQSVHMHFGKQGQFVDSLGANVVINAGELPGAFDPAPTALTLPTPRRSPKILVSGLQRPWGRANGAVSKDALVVEYQPRLVQTKDGNEVDLIRGGDGGLSFDVSLDTVNVLTPPDPSPAIRLPRFRILGLNPPTNVVENLVNRVVESFFNQHQTDAWVQMLTLDVWQTTALLVFKQESGDHLQQFIDGFSHSERLKPYFYANEFKMPYFGGPHGYGIVQADFGKDPLNEPGEPLTETQLLDQIWDFIENLRGGVHHLMQTKARMAYHSLGLPGNQLANPQAAPQVRRLKAIFQRATVRAYNGGSEFLWDATQQDWAIRPSSKSPDPVERAKWENRNAHSEGANEKLMYPNHVFRRGPVGHRGQITYYTGDGQANRIVTVEVPKATGTLTPAQAQAQAQAQANANAAVDARQIFPWPIQFGAADYGPGI